MLWDYVLRNVYMLYPRFVIDKPLGRIPFHIDVLHSKKT